MTPDEKLKFKQALALIADKYSTFINHNPDVRTLMEKPQVFVHFVDARDFDLLRLTTKMVIKADCVTTGFTDYMTTPPKIYINRSIASPGTIVHELLHYLTSTAFRQSFPDAIIEGATEHFTRKLVDPKALEIKPTFSAFVGDRSRHYDYEHRMVNAAHASVKISYGDGARADFMKRAYFRGEEKAIKILQEIFS
jgi:hypothetical protein